MKKTFLFTILSTVAVLQLAVAGAGAYSNFGSFANGFSTSTSASFSNVASIGQPVAGSTENLDYRGFGGFLAVDLAPSDALVNFSDESPTRSEPQSAAIVTCKITVEISPDSGNTIDSVQYRIAIGTNSFGDWQPAAADPDPGFTPSGRKNRYAVTPTFDPLSENYIQWWVQTNGAARVTSSIYSIVYSTGGVPNIAILEPNDKRSIANSAPLIRAAIDNFNPASVELMINQADGTNIATIRSTQHPEIYSNHKVSYKYASSLPLLAGGKQYQLVVRATDAQGNSKQASTTFTVSNSAIADLLPYPSPCDPKKKPVTLRYTLNKRSEVTINIYDMSGRLVKNLVDNEPKPAGTSESKWNARNFAEEELANGVYICELVAKDDDGEHRRYTSLAILGK